MREGFFDLATPGGLFAKLERELERMREHPANVDNAFNFFVTAEHMLDWIHPDPGGKAMRRSLRGSDPLLATVWDLASGAKHFKCWYGHESVKTSEVLRGEADTWTPREVDGAPSWFQRKTALPPYLVVNLDGEAARKFGRSIGALELAEKVVEYWRVSPLLSSKRT